MKKLAAKKAKRKIPSRKLRAKRREVDENIALIAEMIPQTTQVLGLALEAGVRTVNHLVIEKLAQADGQLAAQLVALLTKKRSN
jgi:hypothetical protein